MTTAISSATIKECMRVVTEARASRLGEETFPFFETTKIDVSMPTRSCRRTIYANKNSLLQNLIIAGARDSEHTQIFSSPGLVSSANAALVSREVTFLKSALVYIGDLSPLSLCTYLALKNGGYPAGKPSAALRTISYFGINDEWLSLCESCLLQSEESSRFRAPVALLTKMTKKERGTLQELAAAGLDFEGIVGPQCAEVLRRGHTIDIHVASESSRYNAEFPAKLRSLLLH